MAIRWGSLCRWICLGLLYESFHVSLSQSLGLGWLASQRKVCMTIASSRDANPRMAAQSSLFRALGHDSRLDFFWLALSLFLDRALLAFQRFLAGRSPRVGTCSDSIPNFGSAFSLMWDHKEVETVCRYGKSYWAGVSCSTIQASLSSKGFVCVLQPPSQCRCESRCRSFAWSSRSRTPPFWWWRELELLIVKSSRSQVRVNFDYPFFQIKLEFCTSRK